MGLYATYWIDCDICGDGPGTSKPTQDQAWEYVERSDWWTNRWYGAAVCDTCLNPDVVYHAQWSNVFCALCQSGEHVAIIK